VWASSPAIATKQQNSLIWATVVMDAPDVIAAHKAGLRAFSLTCHVTQRDAEIVAWTF
jgi:nitrate reductase cytochrome c-type subunit